jgi:hypothetical protein
MRVDPGQGNRIDSLSGVNVEMRGNTFVRMWLSLRLASLHQSRRCGRIKANGKMPDGTIYSESCFGRSAMFAVAASFLLAAPAFGAEVDPKADSILRVMSNYLGEQQAFSLTADSSTELLLRDGRKVQLTATSSMLIDRGKGLSVERQGPLGRTQLIYDGKAVAIASEREEVYLSLDAPGSIDAALDEVRSVMGTELAGGSDLLYSNVYDGLMLEVDAGYYMGQAWVDGVLTDHLSYRARDIDWQLWVRSDDTPVPVKYVITSKWVTAAPQFSVQISDFKVVADTSPADFEFSPPTGYHRITAEQLPELDLLAEE